MAPAGGVGGPGFNTSSYARNQSVMWRGVYIKQGVTSDSLTNASQPVNLEELAPNGSRPAPSRRGGRAVQGQVLGHNQTGQFGSVYI